MEKQELQKKIPLVVIVGPTASGKSKLAVELAHWLQTEIVSADSMQIYRGMQIGTAKPTVEEMEGIAHHLIDFVELNEPFSVADYVAHAKTCVERIAQREKYRFWQAVQDCTLIHFWRICSFRMKRKTQFYVNSWQKKQESKECRRW